MRVLSAGALQAFLSACLSQARKDPSFCAAIMLSVDHERKEVDAVAIGPVTYADVENHLLTERYFGGLPYKEFIDARCVGILFTLSRRPTNRRVVAKVGTRRRNSAPLLSWLALTLPSV